MYSNIYKDKKILVTGHTGFKGSWLAIWLNKLGANVVGISLRPETRLCNYYVSSVNEVAEDYFVDIRNLGEVVGVLEEIQPDFIFHLAAQSLVRPSYAAPVDTLSTNAIGTANIMEAVRKQNKPMTLVMITSDKAYDNVEWVWGYRECDALGGKDPYSASKGMAELAIKSYCHSFFTGGRVSLGVARAGNVIGGGDWCKDRIVPDCMKMWSQGLPVEIRAQNSTRPWQHVLEPLSGYLHLGAALYLENTGSIHNSSKPKHGEAYNFGPSGRQNHSVKDLIEAMSQDWGQAEWKDVSSESSHVHEAGLLKLNCDKALHELNWQPTLEFHETVQFTAAWYKKYYQSPGLRMKEFTENQIEEYADLAKERRISWVGEL